MRRVLGALLFAATLAAGAATATAAASPAARTTGNIVSDGARWAAWPVGVERVVVYDDRTRRRREVAVPPCDLTAVGNGLVLMSCRGQRVPLPVLVDVRTGRRIELPRAQAHAEFLEPTAWVGVGRRGLLARISSSFHPSSTHSGYDYGADSVHQLDDRATAIDLDAPGLARPLCAPLKRTPTPWHPDRIWAADPFLPMLYSRPWAVETIPFYREVRRAMVVDGKVRVWRCGQRRPRVLSRSCGCTAQFGAGLVTWLRAMPGQSPRRYAQWSSRPAGGGRGRRAPGRTWCRPGARSSCGRRRAAPAPRRQESA